MFFLSRTPRAVAAGLVLAFTVAVGSAGAAGPTIHPITPLPCSGGSPTTTTAPPNEGLPGPTGPAASSCPTLVNAPVVGTLAYPGTETVTSPFGLQVDNGSVIVHTSAYPAGGPFEVHSPSVAFQFPITADEDEYIEGGLYHAYPSIGWKGTIAAEACLTPAEAAAFTGTKDMGSDLNTCPPEDDLVHTKQIQRDWYQVAVATPDLYVVQNNGFVDVPTSVAVNLQQIDAPMRFHINGMTYFYTETHSGPNDLNAACPVYHCGNTTVDSHTDPFKLVVLPTALIQLKVLPETILYMPPGNGSAATYKVTATFGTTISAGYTTQIDNTNAEDNWIEDTEEVGGTVGVGSKDTGQLYNEGYKSSDDTKWDTKTSLKTGQALEHDIQGMNQRQFVFTRGISATSGAVPGSAGAYAGEPFWNDLVIVLVHPQLAVWDFYGKPTVQLIAASSAGDGLPDDIAVPLSALADCAKNGAQYPNGYGFVTATGMSETLNADECQHLASLDPFYARGQSTVVTGRGSMLIGRQTYGVPAAGADPDSLDIQTIMTQSQTTTNQSTASYASTVEDIVSTTESDGINFGFSTGSLASPLTLGFTDTITLKQGSSIDTAKTMTVTFKNSTATTFKTDILVEGSIKDSVYRGYVPQVEVYRDNVFGSLMFRDPDAQCSPMPMCAIIGPAGPGGPVAAP